MTDNTKKKGKEKDKKNPTERRMRQKKKLHPKKGKKQGNLPLKKLKKELKSFQPKFYKMLGYFDIFLSESYFFLNRYKKNGRKGEDFLNLIRSLVKTKNFVSQRLLMSKYFETSFEDYKACLALTLKMMAQELRTSEIEKILAARNLFNSIIDMEADKSSFSSTLLKKLEKFLEQNRFVIKYSNSEGQNFKQKKELFQFCNTLYREIIPGKSCKENFDCTFQKLKKKLQYLKRAIYLFGSVAESLATRKSDIDVCIVTVEKFGKKAGNDIYPSEQIFPKITKTDLAKFKNEHSLRIESHKKALLKKKNSYKAQLPKDQGKLTKKQNSAITTKNENKSNQSKHDKKIKEIKQNITIIEEKITLCGLRTLAHEYLLSSTAKKPKASARKENCHKNGLKIKTVLHDEIGSLHICQIAFKLKNEGYLIEKVISNTMVPIIKMIDLESKVKIDLAFGRFLGSYSTSLMKDYAEFDPRSKTLIYLVKNWAENMKINDASSGTLSSYCLKVMVIHYLQIAGILPNLQNAKLESHPLTKDRSDKKSNKNKGNGGCTAKKRMHIAPKNCKEKEAEFIHNHYPDETFSRVASCPSDTPIDKLSIVELVFGFFKYYACQFDFINHAVTIHLNMEHLPRLKQYSWPNSKASEIIIEDPILTADSMSPRNLACSVSSAGMKQVMSALKMSYIGLKSGEVKTWAEVLKGPFLEDEFKNVSE
mmetsp:Transcript_954/g.1433  ORF Transcript_954/g.1433 Transcript_954/m.1433 type:complete len:707 (+) Transcript_954:31-2151(+)